MLSRRREGRGSVSVCLSLCPSLSLSVSLSLSLCVSHNFRTGRSSPTQLFYDCSKVLNA